MQKQKGSKSVSVTLKALYCIALMSLFIVFTFVSTNKQVDSISEKIVRLHVIANSDYFKDQEVKLKVRDAILEFMTNNLKGYEKAEDAKRIINDNLLEIENIANDVLRENNMNYVASATLSNVAFPTKHYEGISLPAGYYNALRVRLGDASGENWWCVLFPPLCYVDAAIPEKTKDEYIDELKELLTEEEFILVSEADNPENMPVKVRFKIVELLQETKIEFSALIKKITGE